MGDEVGNVAVASAWLLGAIFIVFAISHVASVRSVGLLYGFAPNWLVRWISGLICACAGVTLLMPGTRLIGATIGVVIMGTALTTSLLDQRFTSACCCMLISVWLTIAVAYGG